MSLLIDYQNHRYVSSLTEGQSPYSNLLNLYLHLMRRYPGQHHLIGRQRIYAENSLTPVDCEVKSVLGKRVKLVTQAEYKNLISSSDVVFLEPYRFNGSQIFNSKESCKEWIQEQKKLRQELFSHFWSRPRDIFAVAQVTLSLSSVDLVEESQKTFWVVTHNQQHEHLAYHAEVLLILALSEHVTFGSKINWLWTDLSPCRMCAGLISELQKQLDFKVFYSKKDNGRLAQSTFLSNKMNQREQF
jgi:deoxycytidylate deaminase